MHAAEKPWDITDGSGAPGGLLGFASPPDQQDRNLDTERYHKPSKQRPPVTIMVRRSNR